MNTRNACLLTVIHFQRKLTVKQISPIFTFASSLILNSLGALDALFWCLRKSAKLTNRIIRILRHFQPMKRLYYDTLLYLKVWLIFREIRINKHGKTLTRNRGSFFFQTPHDSFVNLSWLEIGEVFSRVVLLNCVSLLISNCKTR